MAKRERTERQKIGVGVGIGIGVEKGIGTAFGHEKLDVYRAAIEYVGRVYRFCEALVAADVLRDSRPEAHVAKMHTL